MNSQEEDAGGYRVGNKCPPKDAQFKKGISGNPSGKRKRETPTKSLSEVLNEHLRENITVTVGDRQKRMTRFEALALGLIRDAQKGNAAARKQLFDLLRAGTPHGNPAMITMDAEPCTFSWTEEQDRLLAELRRLQVTATEEDAEEERQRKEREELRMDVERLKEAREQINADLEWGKEELARIRSSSPRH